LGVEDYEFGRSVNCFSASPWTLKRDFDPFKEIKERGSPLPQPFSLVGEILTKVINKAVQAKN
jgi:hypothetical protein